MATNKFVTGDCDCCELKQVIVTEAHGMMMCNSCRHLQDEATARAVAANTFVKESRESLETVVIKLDVFHANTEAAQKVMAAILADDSIPASQKDYAMAQESLNNYLHFKKVIFDKREAFAKEMSELENAQRAWQVQVHTFAAKVEGAEKEKFRNFDVSYQPKPVKVTKSSTSSKAPNSYKKPTKVELFDAAKKYAVPMAAVAFLAASRNMTADQAANEIASNRTQTQATN